MAHQGRPGGDDFVSLAQHAESSRTTSTTTWIRRRDVRATGDHDIAVLDGGDVLVLENTRMCDDELPEEDPEVKAQTAFVQTLTTSSTPTSTTPTRRPTGRTRRSSGSPSNCLPTQDA